MGIPIERLCEEPNTSPKNNRVVFETVKDIPGENLEQKLERISQCKCCERHQTKKPVKLETWKETEFHGTYHFDYEPICDCPCRHLARHICRQV